MTMNITQLVEQIPVNWRLVPVNGKKCPVDPQTGLPLKDWTRTTYEPAEILSGSPHIKAVGVLTGVPSNGLLCIDIDSLKGQAHLETITGKALADFPETIGCSSGKEGSQKLFYQVPESDMWEKFRTRRCSGLDILWNGCQAVLAGEHPTTGGYYWLEGQSPSEIGLANAPEWLVDALVQYLNPQSEKKNKSRSFAKTELNSTSLRKQLDQLELDTNRDIRAAFKALQRLNPDDHDRYEPWLKVGMCLHSVDDSLLETWINWSSYMDNFDEQECIAKWNTFSDCNAYFEKTGQKGLGLGTLLSMASSRRQDIHESEELIKLIKDKDKGNLALLNYLRTWDIRFNELKRRVEIDGKVLQYDPKYFYLHFAEATGLTIPREVARDALVTVAQENGYNPVAEYLDSVLPLASVTEAISDDELAKWFGLSNDDSVSIGLLRIHLRACAIRGMQPGSKMDSVLILCGKMGLRKSSTIKMLPPDEAWYDETTRLDIDNKDTLSAMNSAWHSEFSEVEKLTATRDSSVVKAWVTRSSDNYVEKYESVVTEHPRRTCLWGTTNSGAFLNDPTGSRRY